MVVNALVTGLIVFKILRVSLEFKPTSVEQTLGSTRGPLFQHIIFIIIESGMALFAIQLAHVVISSLNQIEVELVPISVLIALNVVIPMHEMLNVIITSDHFLLLLFY